MDEIGARGIGRRVAAYRRAAGLTAEQLAARVGNGMTRAAIAKLENGHRVEVSTDLLIRLAWSLNIPPLALLLPLENPDAVLFEAEGRPYTVSDLGAWVLGIPGSDYPLPLAGNAAYRVTSAFRQLVVDAAAADETHEELLHNEVEQPIDTDEISTIWTRQLTDDEIASHRAAISRLRDSAAFARRTLVETRHALGLDADG